jgi:hypothetical protein
MLRGKLNDQYQQQIKRTKTTGIPQSGVAKENTPTLSTRAEVQALPSGAHFIYNGVEHVKKLAEYG